VSKKVSPLRMAILAAGLTEADFSRDCGYTPGSGRQVINGNVAAWPQFQKRAAARLGVDKTILFGDDPVAAAAAVLNAKAGASSPITDCTALAQVASVVQASGGGHS